MSAVSNFSVSRLALVARKEFTDLLRDRKSIFWALFAVAISGPLVVGILYFVVQSVTERIDKTTAPIVNAQFAPDLVSHFERRGIKIDADPKDYEARVKSGDLDAVIVIDPDFAASLASGRAARITLVTESSRDRSMPIAGKLSREIDAYADQIGKERLMLRGVSPFVANPVRIDTLDLDLHYKSDPSLPTPTLGVLILGADGRVITSAGNWLDQAPLQRRADGGGRAQLSLPLLPLLKGRYTVSVYVLCERAINVHAAAEHALSFEVVQDHIEQGVVSLPHQWRMDPV